MNSLNKQSGMTLLEVLVATAILAVISSMAFLSLDTLVKSKQSLQQVTDELNQFNLVQFQLQNDIQMAITSGPNPIPLSAPEFTANSQSITLLRYGSGMVPNQRNIRSNNQQSRQNIANQRMIRVRWYLRNNQWYRASQSAAIPMRSNQWQERPMLVLKSLNCSYQNSTGLEQSAWPNSLKQNSQLPDVINCQVQMANDQRSVLKLVPWQQAGWL